MRITLPRLRLAARRGAAALAIAAVGLLVVTPAASAQADDGDISWAVQPSTEHGPDGRDAFKYTLGPGESVTDYVGVSNFGKTAVKMKVYAMDAIMTQDGAFTLPPAGTPNKDLGGWIGLTGGPIYTIEPGQRLDIPFRLAVPTTVAPGDHAGGIVASLAEPVTTGDGAQQVIVDRRVGARIYLTVPGERNPELTVSDVQVGYSGGWHPTSGTATVSYAVTNSGNIRLAATADLGLQGIGGWALGAVSAKKLPEILPGSTIRITETLPGIFPAFRLTANVTVTPVSVGDAGDDAGAAANAAGSALAVPYLILAALAILLILIVVLVIRHRRRRRRARAGKGDKPTDRSGGAHGSVPAAPADPVGDATQDDRPADGEPVPVGVRGDDGPTTDGAPQRTTSPGAPA